MDEWQQLKEQWLKPLGGLLLFPYILYREIRDQVGLWKTRTHAPLAGKAGGDRALKDLITRLNRYRDEASVRQERLCQGIIAKLFIDPSSAVASASRTLLTDIIWYEGFLRVPDIDLTNGKPSTGRIWEMEEALSRVVDSFEKTDALEARLERVVNAILVGSDLREKQATREAEAMFPVPLYTLLPSPILSVERMLAEIVTEPWTDSSFHRLWRQLMDLASGIDPSHPGNREPVWPSKANVQAEEVIERYLVNTPFISFLKSPLPLMSFSSRFEHTHMVGGSGHGKTQLWARVIYICN